ncbi:nucleoside deaminase [Microbacterium murale]|uniref:Creatinine deaminase n=1 Tax=Microbacterium murale TaxID=1081040 RepID=A0ABU0P5T4_9MICO|nr:nucleoside deaminase [Microbacterium murale]MDQ0642695.1 creatinine deaminase [Microbacterium murale]
MTEITTSAVTITPELARKWMNIALAEADAGAAEGGQPIGSVLIGADGEVLGLGRNRFAQRGDVSAHAETEAFSDAPYQESYEGTTMVTTAEPCWYCSGLIRQFGISRVVIGAGTGTGGAAWLEELGREVHRINDPRSLEFLEGLRAGWKK